MDNVRDEFSVHRLNDAGLQKADALARIFSRCLDALEQICGADGREMALVRTKLQETCFFARRAIAVKTENQAE